MCICAHPTPHCRKKCLESWVFSLCMLHSFLSDTWARPTACLFLEPTARCPWFSCRQAAVRYASAALRNKLPTMTDLDHLPQTNREQSAAPPSDHWTHTRLGTDPVHLSSTCSWKRRRTRSWMSAMCERICFEVVWIWSRLFSDSEILSHSGYFWTWLTFTHHNILFYDFVSLNFLDVLRVYTPKLFYHGNRYNFTHFIHPGQGQGQDQHVRTQGQFIFIQSIS